MNKDFLSKNIIQNLIEVMSIAVKYSAHQGAKVEDLKGSLKYFSGCEFPFFNGVFNNYQHTDAGVKDDLEKVNEYFKERETPYIWWWLQQSEMPENVKKALDEQGFQFLGEFLGIAAELKATTLIHSNSLIQTTRVCSDEEYKQFIAILCEVFQLSESIAKDFEEMYKSYGVNGKFIHYLGYYEGEPVATLSTYANGEIAGFYNGATLAKVQKMGLCSILAQNAINEAINLGCKYGISQLMTPGMAKGLSEKMGFKKYCSMYPYLKDPRSPCKALAKQG